MPDSNLRTEAERIVTEYLNNHAFQVIGTPPNRTSQDPRDALTELIDSVYTYLLRVQQAQRERLLTIVRDILVEELPGADSTLERVLDAIRQEGEGTNEP